MKPIAHELQAILNTRSNDDSECVANQRARLARCPLRDEPDGNAPRERNGTGASSDWHMDIEEGH